LAALVLLFLKNLIKNYVSYETQMITHCLRKSSMLHI